MKRKVPVANSANLKSAWGATDKALPLYSWDMQNWFFIAARLEGKARLFLIPEENREEIETRYNITLDRNKIRHMSRILQGKNDLEPDDPQAFRGMVKKMIGGSQGDRFAAREVDGYQFGLFINKTEDSVSHRFMGGYGGIFQSENDISYGPSKNLGAFRGHYRKGGSLSFFVRGASVTFQKGHSLAEYFERTAKGVAICPSGGGAYSGTIHEKITGFYKIATGLPEGPWTRQTSVSANPGDTPNPRSYKADYKNGVLQEGSLAGDLYSDRFQSAPSVSGTIRPR